MTKKEINNTLNDAVAIATSVAYTKKEIQKLKSFLEEKTKQPIVEYIQGPAGTQGLRGPIGATGAQGERGIKGDAGERGEQGFKGEVGPQGNMGLEGPRGLKGDKGDRGERGEQGEVGQQGLQGDKGDTGERGPQGEIGPQGVQGKDGVDGQDGKDGAQGLKGQDGAAGPNGAPGKDGQQGPIGPQGLQGIQGVRGEKGDKGDPGKDADLKTIEQSINQFKEVLQKDVTQYKARVNTIISNGVGVGGGGSGEVNLRYLDDVDRDSIANGYVLSYDEISQKFTFVSPTAGSGSFTPTDVKQVFAEIKNAENFTITKGQPVYLYAATGNKASVKLANNTGDATSAKTLGLVYSSSITPGGTGLVITQGTLTGVNTNGYAEGATLYLGNTAGVLTSTKPYAPQHLVYIGVVERANQGQGQIYVRPQNGYELNEIHDVSINHSIPLSNGDILVWNSANTLWENRPIDYLGLSTSDALARTTANSAWTAANNAATLAQAAYNQANTGGGTGIDTLARTTANSATTLAQAAYNQANTGAGASESLNVVFTNNSASSYRMVALNVSGETILASALQLTQVDKILGVLNNSGQTVTFGAITNPSWTWTPEQSLYLGDNGNIVTTSTIDGAAFSLKIGYAISSTKAFIKIGTPVVL